MPYSTALELLQKALPECKITGTTASEPGTGVVVSIAPASKEIFHFYRIDSSNGRACLNIPTEEKCCDYLILHARDQANPQKEIICMLELKGGHFTKAVQQLINVFEYLKIMAEQQLKREQYRRVIFCAGILMHGSAPRPKEERLGRERLKRIFQDNERICIKHGVKKDQDQYIGPHLRKLYVQ